MLSTITIDGVLLFSLVIPFVMKYAIAPGFTPYWLFTLIFILLVGYFFVTSLKVKAYLVWVVITLTIGSAYASSIIIRHQTAPVYDVHDIILQLESAVRFFLEGKNPYAVTYFGTPLESWNYEEEVNPALYHFVMPPFYLLFALPFYVLNVSFFGFFDGRLPLVLAFIGILVILHRWVDLKYRSLALILFAFNPATINYFMEGRSDFAMFFPLIASFYFLYKHKIHWSSIFLALAFATKQSAWPLYPLFIYFLYQKGKWPLIMRHLLSFSITMGIICLPFLVWDPTAFIESTITYLAGGSATSYPVSSYGFGMLLYQFGIIKNIHDYFPFTIWQFMVSLPVIYFLCTNLKKHLTVKSLVFSYAIYLFIFWYFARYLNNSHLGFISSVLLVAYFIPDDKKLVHHAS